MARAGGRHLLRPRRSRGHTRVLAGTRPRLAACPCPAPARPSERGGLACHPRDSARQHGNSSAVSNVREGAEQGRNRHPSDAPDRPWPGEPTVAVWAACPCQATWPWRHAPPRSRAGSGATESAHPPSCIISALPWQARGGSVIGDGRAVDAGLAVAARGAGGSSCGSTNGSAGATFRAPMEKDDRPRVAGTHPRQGLQARRARHGRRACRRPQEPTPWISFPGGAQKSCW